MRLVITGAAGQVGRALLDAAAAKGYAATGFDRESLDVSDAAAIASAIETARPDWVMHCAAATKVDTCETETDWAETLNARAPGFVADACRAVGAGLLHYSTDFVFDGEKGAPYVEGDATGPVSVYGATKERGEHAVATSGLERWFVVRTQWVYGPAGRCFPAAILARADDGQPLKVVDDQTGSPTTSLDLADASLELIEAHAGGRAASGVYHASNAGETTWYDFARAVLDRAGHAGVPIERISSESLALPATRPSYSTLDCSKLEAAIGRGMPSWQSGLDAWFEASGLTTRHGASETREEGQER